MEFLEKDNQLSQEFLKHYLEVRKNFFSRNPELWPIFNDPIAKRIIENREEKFQSQKSYKEFANGEFLRESLLDENEVPQESTIDGKSITDTLAFVGSLSKNWEDPSSVENVVGMASDPAIYGSVLAMISNPNMVHREYCEMSEDLERASIRMMANLAGYDVEHATGIFTQGGTFCNIYGYLLGIRKNLPSAKYFGMGYTADYRIINSQGGHYSNITNLSLLGVSIKEKTIRIRMEENNHIDLKDLEYQMEACFRLKCVVPVIMLTMGTTDTFGVDRVYPVYEIRERLCEKFGVKEKPHIHVDSAIGWTMLFYLDYDFDNNPLNINPQTLEGLKRNKEKFEELKYADSFTVDFQKWGYVPYTSSLVMIKNKEDLRSMENDPENFQYFEKEKQGHTHLQSTIECSRGATGIYGAYAAMKYMGKSGFQTIIAHCLQNANYFRCKLKQFPYVKVLSSENQGPSVGFRIYNPETVTSADDEFHLEYNKNSNEEYMVRLQKNNTFHRDIFLKRGKVGLYTNWVGVIAHSSYDELNNYVGIPGEKAVFMNPKTTREEIDLFIDNLLAAY